MTKSSSSMVPFGCVISSEIWCEVVASHGVGDLLYLLLVFIADKIWLSSGSLNPDDNTLKWCSSSRKSFLLPFGFWLLFVNLSLAIFKSYSVMLRPAAMLSFFRFVFFGCTNSFPYCSRRTLNASLSTFRSLSCDDMRQRISSLLVG